MAAGHRVVIAADRRPLAFLKWEFPQLEFVVFMGTHIRYSYGSGMIGSILRQLPSLVTGLIREHRRVRQLIKEYRIDLVISDNRYGLWNKKVPTVFITHQLQIQAPPEIRFLQPLLRRLVSAFIKRYTYCWIPDFPNHRGLAGDLSHPGKLPANASYIGTLSRFPIPKNSSELPNQESAEVVVLLSGPEPQRTILEKKIMEQLLKTTISAIVVRGMTERSEMIRPNENIRIYTHLESTHLQYILSNALVVICRSGYSSIMDITALGKRAILIPTPGQTEQEYLARYLMSRKIFFSMSQDTFDLIYALEMSINYPGMVLQNNYNELSGLLKEALR